MKKILAAIFLTAGFILAMGISVFASTSSVLQGEEYMEYIKGITGLEYQRPYITTRAGEEYIAPSSGALILTATDLVIPGKNGHDVVIKRQYISQDSGYDLVSEITSETDTSNFKINYQGYRYTTQPNGGGTEYYILFYTEQQMYVAGKDVLNVADGFTSKENASLTYNGNTGYIYKQIRNFSSSGGVNLYRDKTAPAVTFVSDGREEPYTGHDSDGDIGHGWSLLYPKFYWDFVDETGETYIYSQDDVTDGSVTFQLGQLNRTSKYTYCTVSEPVTSLHQQGTKVCPYKITKYTGEEYYFDADGAPYKHVDRFGNEITYIFSNGKLQKIIDTYGREIQFYWENNRITKITFEDIEIIYDKTVQNNNTEDPNQLLTADNDYTLKVTRKQVGATSGETVEYKAKKVYGLVKRGTCVLSNLMYTIEQIKHPTGGITEYEYDPSVKTYLINEKRVDQEKYRITARRDLESPGADKVYQEKSYEYLDPIDYEYHTENFFGNNLTALTSVHETDGCSYLYGFRGKGINYVIDKRKGSYHYVTEKSYIGERYYPKVSEEKVTEYVGEYSGSGTQTVTKYEYSHEQITKQTVEQNGQISSCTEWSYQAPYKGYERDSRQYHYLYGDEDLEEAYAQVINKKEWITAPDETQQGEAVITEYNYSHPSSASSMNLKAVSQVKTYPSTNFNDVEQEIKYEYNASGEVTKLTQKVDEADSTGSSELEPVWDITQYLYTDGRNEDNQWFRTVTTRKTGEAGGQSSYQADTVVTYDAYGNQTHISGYGVDETENEYDVQGRMVKERYPGDNTQITYEYEIGGANGTRTTITDQAGTVTRVKYDGLGRYQATEIYPTANTALETEQVEYDSLGRIAEKTISKGSSENDRFTVFTTYWSSGKVKKEEIKNSAENILKRTEYAYDESFQDTGDYDQNCQVVTVTQLVSGSGDGTEDETTVFKRYVDPVGRVHKEEAYLNNQTAYKTTYEYDLRGNVTNSVSPRDNADHSFTGKSMQYEYDCAGRQIQVTDAANRTSFVTYDGLGRTVRERGFDGTEVLYEYDAFGNVVSQKTLLETESSENELYDSPKYAETLNLYDTSGNLISQKVKNNPVEDESNASSAQSEDQPTYRVTNMGYDSRKRLDYVEAEETDGSKTYTKYFYDNKGNTAKVVTGLTSPNVAQDAIPAAAHVTEYSYEPYLNSMTEVTQPDGTTQYYNYNYFNLVDSQGFRKNGETYGTVNYQYSALGNVLSAQAADDMKSVQYAYDKLGQVTQIVDESGTRNFEYDSLGRLVKETNGTEVKEYGYDEDGNRTWFSLKQGETVVQQQEYVYDRIGLLTQVKDGTGPSLLAILMTIMAACPARTKAARSAPSIPITREASSKVRPIKKLPAGR